MATITSSKILGLNMMTYLPTNYISTTAYPCLMFLPGSGEIGTNPALLQAHGPFAYIKQGVDVGLNLIVIAIQNVNPNPRPSEVQQYITAVKSLYNISGFIGTGLSRGGQDWDWFVSNAESQLAQMIGMVMFSSQGPVSDTPGIAGTWTPKWFVDTKVPYWFGIGTQDPFYDANKARYNALIASGATAYWTEWPGVGHSDPVWSDGYNPAWIKNSLGKSIYTWAASLGQPVVVTPPPPPPPAKTIVKVTTTVYYSDNTTDSFTQP